MFRSGLFAEAQRAYQQLFNAGVQTAFIARQLGKLHLYKNNFLEAEYYLNESLSKSRRNTGTTALLAELHYRRDDFPEVPSLLRAIGMKEKAEQLEALHVEEPYRISGAGDTNSVDFISTDPLPVVSVRINDSEEVNFIIDTGAGETILDTTFAAQLKLKIYGSFKGEFGGGRKQSLSMSIVDKLSIGNWDIHSLPVQVLDTSKFSAAAAGKKISGVIGAIFFYHFLTTLDYPNGALILRHKTDAGQLKAASIAGNEHRCPFWLAGDHYMVANGQINNSEEMLFFIDTGIGGAGFTCPPSTLKQAGIAIPKLTESGIGGGGKISVAAFTAEQLSLCSAVRKNVRCFYGPFPPSLEYGLGFRIGGLLSQEFFRHYAVTFDFKEMNLKVH